MPGEYFTSGSDYASENNFSWCALNQSLSGQRHLVWAEGEPSAVDSFGNKEDCVVVSLNKGLVRGNVLKDADCKQKYNFICEVSAAPNACCIDEQNDNYC